MNRVYKTIISDYKGNCFMEYIPAKSKKEVIEHWGGNGDFEKIEEVEYPIHLESVQNALEKDGFGRAEVDIIIRTLAKSIPTR